MKKILFIDRDGTLIREPEDQQVDTLEKLELMDGVIPALLALRDAGYRFVMVTNQDGLGTASFPTPSFEIPQKRMLQIFSSQGIRFDEVLVCPHKPEENCLCRKPHLALVRPYLCSGEMDMDKSAVVGDRATDIILAKNMGIQGYRIGETAGPETYTWASLTEELLRKPRKATVIRKTNETNIEVEVNLDGRGTSKISTGIEFFDHMLDQIAKHGGLDLSLKCEGDLQVDEHHTVEDCALAIGTAIRKAVGDKVGIGRYGWILPMDEARAQVALDLSGRPYFVFKGNFGRDKVGALSTELVPHFYKSLSDALLMNLHIEVEGENAHHMIEATFKGVGRALRMALAKTNNGELPSTKGTLS